MQCMVICLAKPAVGCIILCVILIMATMDQLMSIFNIYVTYLNLF